MLRAQREADCHLREEHSRGRSEHRTRHPVISIFDKKRSNFSGHFSEVSVGYFSHCKQAGEFGLQSFHDPPDRTFR
jgi:hypothetical protein